MNAGIVSMLEQMMRLRLEQGETGKVHGYTRAIRAIQAYPYQITSAQQAVSIPGVGPSLSQRIGEFLTTGRVAELAGSEEKNRIIELFMSVDRVGMVKAEEWYRAGYRRLEDISRWACTDAQWIGIQLYPDLSQRIPREEIDVYNQLLNQYLSPLGIRYQICGSYRRGRPTSGDMDVLVIDIPGRDTMTEVLRWPYLTHSLAAGPKKFLGVCRLSGRPHRRIDIELVQPEEYPYAVTYFTGPASFNVKMRDYCRNYGLRLNEKSLLNAQGQPILVDSEQQLFQILGIQWLTPEQRDAY